MPIDLGANQLLPRLRDILAEQAQGQDRLNAITKTIAQSLSVEVCSIYLTKSHQEFELYSTYGLDQQAVHKTIMQSGQGLVGRIAKTGKVINSKNSQTTRGYEYKPETREEIYHGFLGVPIQRLGKVIGVLVLQSIEERAFQADEVSAIEIIAIVLAEMAELGEFSLDNETAPQLLGRFPRNFEGQIGQEGSTIGQVVLHNPKIAVTRPVADDPTSESLRLHEAFIALDAELASLQSPRNKLNEEVLEIIATFESFSRDKGFRRRLLADIDAGLSAEAAIEVEQSRIRSRMQKISDPYLRDRMTDIDDFSNRLLRILTGVKRREMANMPQDAVLVARNIGPAELLEYGRTLKGIVLTDGSVGSHAAIIARAWSIPLVLQARGIIAEAQEGDAIILDGDHGTVFLRPDETVIKAYQEKIRTKARARAAFDSLRDLPAKTLDNVQIALHMNAGLLGDLPSLSPSGADGVGLFRTELQFLTSTQMPKRHELVQLYKRVLDSAGDKPVIFRTLDIGSDKILPYFDHSPEPNPAMGWRAIRLGLDRSAIMKLQFHGLFRAADGRALKIMFPFIAQREEFDRARELAFKILEVHKSLGYVIPQSLQIGAMLETPSLAFAPGRFYDDVDFLSVGGNDLKQFFFAADRENERVRRRYDTLNTSYLRFLQHINERAKTHNTPISFCGEDAGRPIEALAFVAMGFRALSMRPASIGLVKNLLRQVHIHEVEAALESAFESGEQSVRKTMEQFLQDKGISLYP